MGACHHTDGRNHRGCDGGGVTFSIIPNVVDGQVGSYTLYKLDANGLPTNEVLGTVSNTNTKWQVTSNSLILEVDKTAEQKEQDDEDSSEITTLFTQNQNTIQTPQAGTDNGNTGNPGGTGGVPNDPPPPIQGNQSNSGTPDAPQQFVEVTFVETIPTITYTITTNDEEPANNAPDAVDDAFTGNEDTQITGNVLANDSDVETATPDLTVVPANFITANGGTVNILANGDFNWLSVKTTGIIRIISRLRRG